jgi:hypothetical protein
MNMKPTESELEITAEEKRENKREELISALLAGTFLF